MLRDKWLYYGDVRAGSVYGSLIPGFEHYVVLVVDVSRARSGEVCILYVNLGDDDEHHSPQVQRTVQQPSCRIYWSTFAVAAGQ